MQPFFKVNLADFDIGLELAEHTKIEFQSHLDHTFFELKDNSLYKSGSIELKMYGERLENSLNLAFELEGHLDAVCDRCLNEIELAVNASFNHVLNYTEEEELVGTEGFVSSKQKAFSVYDVVYEQICLNAPSRHLCENAIGRDKCEMFAINVTHPSESDPRWNDLKKLIE